MPEPVLELRDIRVDYTGPRGFSRAVDGVSLSLSAGDRLGLVGESGCGKSSLAHAIMGLLPNPGAGLSGRSMRVDGQELIGLSERAFRRVRQKSLVLIPQNPAGALNPVQSVGRQMASIIKRRLDVSRRRARQQAADALAQLDLGDIEALLERYPHQLSGGTSQRVLIALALACRPRLLICDEPTSALDPTTRAGVLDRLSALCDHTGTALLLITHDFGIVAGHCERTAVMYQGRIVEEAPVDALFNAPRHPYTRALLAAIPRLPLDATER